MITGEKLTSPAAVRSTDGLATVGLFGYYGQCNFGDDLMAELFARKLLEAGLRVVVYGYAEPFMESAHLSCTRSLEYLCEACDAIVFGGGGALIPNSKNSGFSLKIGELVDRCAALNVPILCVSIGGNGLPLEQVVPESRRRLAKAAKLLIIRNPAEADQLARTGLNARFVHDVVWTTSSVFGGDSAANEPERALRVALNLYPDPILSERLDSLFGELALRPGPVRWSFLETHTFGPEWWQAYRPDIACDRFETHQFIDVGSGVSYLSQCDVVITNRLHAGIVAMSYGKPCIALDAVPKTRLCFDHLGLSEFIWDAEEVNRLEVLNTSQGIEQLQNVFRTVNLDPVRKDAEQNFEGIRTWLANGGLLS